MTIKHEYINAIEKHGYWKDSEIEVTGKEEMAKYEADALTVVDLDTSIPPEGKAAREVSDEKYRRIQFLRLFDWARFVI